ncbi:MAG: hypothetical protein ACUVV0_03200 [Anaerolineae bacterium]
MGNGSLSWGRLALYFVFLSALYILTASGRICPGDEETMYRVTRNLVERGDIAIERELLRVEGQSWPGLLPCKSYTMPTNYASPGVGGRFYSKYGLGQSLFSIPLYLIGKGLTHVPGTYLNSQYLSKLCVAMINPLFTAATCTLLLAFCSALGLSPGTGLVLSLGYGFSSMAWAYTKNFFSEPAAAFFLLATAYALYRLRADPPAGFWALWAGAALGLAVLFRTTALMTVPFFAAYLFFAGPEPKVRRTLLFAGPLVLAVALVLLYNFARFGSVLESGYTEVAWDLPFFAGLYGLLFSPGKGFFLYNPAAFIALGGMISFYVRHRAEAILFASIAAAYVAFHAPYNFWSGGWNWGPRFLLPITPLLFVSIGFLLEGERARLARILLALLLAFGLFIQIPAILIDHSRYLVALSEKYPEDFYGRTIYQTELSPVLRQWPVALEAMSLFAEREYRQEIKSLLAERWEEVAGEDPLGDTVSDVLLWQNEIFRLNVPDFWWVHLYLLRVPPGQVALFLVPLLAIMAGAAAWPLWRVVGAVKLAIHRFL